MTAVHAQQVGDKAVLPWAEFERLVELARQLEEIEVRVEEDDVGLEESATTLDIMRLAERGGAFDFWREEGEDIYTAEDGEPV